MAKFKHDPVARRERILNSFNSIEDLVANIAGEVVTAREEFKNLIEELEVENVGKQIDDAMKEPETIKKPKVSNKSLLIVELLALYDEFQVDYRDTNSFFDFIEFLRNK